MRTTSARQALVAVGGRSSRLRSGGFDVRLSKSFIGVSGRPLLHWCLSSLYQAGIRDVVLCGNEAVHLREAEATVTSAHFTFDNVRFFRDPGLGMHGLPWQARDLLENEFIFECGHSIMTPNHYKHLFQKKRPGRVVTSGFHPHPDNVRQPVSLRRGRVELATRAARQAIAHPFVVDQEYVRRLPELNFDIHRIIRHYSSLKRLTYVMSDMPPEFDVVPEMLDAVSIYKDYLSRAVR